MKKESLKIPVESLQILRLNRSFSFARVQKKATRIAALDFLRIIGALGVLLYHLLPARFPGGYLAVVIFFVLSGFLSMRKYIIQSPGGEINYLQDFKKRAKSIYPSMLLMIFTVLAVMIFFFPEFISAAGSYVISSLLSVNNIVQIIKGDSYFEGFGFLKPFTHLWALSMEVQFYLIFYFIILPLYQKLKKKGTIILTSIAALVSIAAKALVIQNEIDQSAIYYNTLLRLAPFLIGITAALIFYEDDGEVISLSPVFSAGMSIFLLAFLIFAILRCEFNDFNFAYMMPFYALISALVCGFMSSSDNHFADLFKAEHMKYVGSFSYLLYLWHYPMIKFAEKFSANRSIKPQIYISLLLFLIFVFTFLAVYINLKLKKLSFRKELLYALTLILLIFPYYFFAEYQGKENLDKLKGDILQAEAEAEAFEAKRREMLQAREESSSNDDAEKLRSDEYVSKTNEDAGEADSSSAEANETPHENAGEVAVSSEKDENSESCEISQSKTTQSEENLDIQQAITAESTSHSEASEASSNANLKPLAGDEEVENLLNEVAAIDADLYYTLLNVQNEISAFEAAGTPSGLNFTDYLNYRNSDACILGDSITVVSSYTIRPYMPFLQLNMKSNRELNEAPQLIQDMISAGEEPRHALILMLGTNGPVTFDLLKPVYNYCLDRNIALCLCTIVLPYPIEESERNAAIYEFVEAHPDVYLLDWHKAAKNNPQFFQEDNIHPSSSGNSMYAQLIAAKLIEIYRDRNIELPLPIID